jgi:hypothetical protein
MRKEVTKKHIAAAYNIRLMTLDWGTLCFCDRKIELGSDVLLIKREFMNIREEKTKPSNPSRLTTQQPFDRS